MGDHLLEHLLPVNVWGSEYVSVPIETRSAGDVFRVLGNVDHAYFVIFAGCR